MTDHETRMETTGQEFMGKLLAQANADPAFRHKLETDPAPIFAAVGLELAPGVRFVCEPATRETAAAVAARSSELEIHIPILRQAGELSDEDLARVNGGVGGGLFTSPNNSHGPINSDGSLHDPVCTSTSGMGEARGGRGPLPPPTGVYAYP